MEPLTLRNYQRDAMEEIQRNWVANKLRVILSLPTGGGKTETAIAIMSEAHSQGKRCLVIVDRLVLCDQWIKRMHHNGLIDTGKLQGERTSRSEDAAFIVATAQTIASRGINQDFGLVVIDECHYWHKTHQEVMNAIKPKVYVIGLSATPLNQKMIEFFDAVVAPVSAAELVQTGSLVRSRTFIPNGGKQIQRALKGVAIKQGDFKSSELDKAMRGIEIMGDVVHEWLKLGENRPTIAFCVSVKHAQALAAQFEEQGVPSFALTQETNLDQREKIITDFERGKIKVLTSVNVLAVGFDSPIASCAIFARPTLSKSLHVQMAGRVLRLFKEKNGALILDHAGNIERHGQIENFVIPQSINELKMMVDKVPRNLKTLSQDIVCESCWLMYQSTLPSCPGCGHKRTEKVLRVVDGELREMIVSIFDTPPGIDPHEVAAFNLVALRYARWMGFRTAWALYKTVKRFNLLGDPKSPEVLRIVQPKGASALSWINVSLNQNELDWFESNSKSHLSVTLEQINETIESFQIDTRGILGLQPLSINRMRRDSRHSLKVIICAAIASKYLYKEITLATISEVINKATQGTIKDVEIVACYVAKKGVATISSGMLIIDLEQLPFNNSDSRKVIRELGNEVSGDFAIPCFRTYETFI